MIPPELKGYIISLDTETADLGDHVCEIGISIFKDSVLYKEWGTFVKPIIPISPDAAAVHHIYDTDVEDAPSFADIAQFLHNLLESADAHIAYNYEYDRKVLTNEFERIGMQYPVKPMVDPFIFFKKYHKFRKGKKLVDAAEEYGIPYVGAHRAVNDATMAGKVLFKMAATKPNFPKNIKVLVKQQRKLVEDQYIDFASYMKKVGRKMPDRPIYEYFEVEI